MHKNRKIYKRNEVFLIWLYLSSKSNYSRQDCFEKLPVMDNIDVMCVHSVEILRNICMFWSNPVKIHQSCTIVSNAMLMDSWMKNSWIISVSIIWEFRFLRKKVITNFYQNRFPIILISTKHSWMKQSILNWLRLLQSIFNLVLESGRH